MSSVFFRSVLAKLRREIQHAPRAKIHSRFDTSDVVQEGALQVWEQAKRQNISFSKFNTAWLKSIAIGHLCKLKRFHLAAMRTPNVESSGEFQLAMNTHSPDQAAIQKESAIRLLELVDQLDQTAAKIIFGKFYERKSLVELGEETGLSYAQTKYLYQQTLRRISVKMKSSEE